MVGVLDAIISLTLTPVGPFRSAILRASLGGHPPFVRYNSAALLARRTQAPRAGFWPAIGGLGDHAGIAAFSATFTLA